MSAPMGCTETASKQYWESEWFEASGFEHMQGPKRKPYRQGEAFRPTAPALAPAWILGRGGAGLEPSTSRVRLLGRPRPPLHRHECRGGVGIEFCKHVPSAKARRSWNYDIKKYNNDLSWLLLHNSWQIKARDSPGNIICMIRGICQCGPWEKQKHWKHSKHRNLKNLENGIIWKTLKT